MSSTSPAERYRGTGVMWQGSITDVESIQHMLFKFEVQVAQNGLQLLLIQKDLPPILINLGDEIIVDEACDQVGILRSEVDWTKKKTN